jgi:phosphate transport system protein
LQTVARFTIYHPAMQISREIERVGDLSMSIMKLTKSIKEKHELISKFNIADIVREKSKLFIKTNECFQNMDETSIEEIFIKQRY